MSKDPLDPTNVAPTETNDADFQFVLKELLAAYQPILEEELKRAKSADQLSKDAEAGPPSCDYEIQLAHRIFDRFVNEQVAMRLLPAQARDLLGPFDRWKWCLLHIRCCIIFGWLLCRGPRTFRAYAYYLYQYWKCIRELLGQPVANPPSPDQRQDFQRLVAGLAQAYKPYLTDQLATVEFPAGIPDEIFSGAIDCHEGGAEAAAIFQRLLTTDTAEALLGKQAFELHVKEPWFWFCRCWCLCSIYFGCCLARARSIFEVLWCLIFYWRCLRDCFQPLRCEITAPTGCTAEEINPQVQGMTVNVEGTAAGGFFHHYTVEWRKAEGQACDDDSNFSQAGIVYPPGGGTTAVVNGLLAYFNTTFLSAGSYDVRVCVYSSQQGAGRQCCCITFDLFKQLVWIDRVANAPMQTPPGPFVSTAPIVNTNPGGIVVPVGCCVTVRGSAFVGDCSNRRIQCFDLRYGLGFLPGPGEIGFNPADYFGSLLVPTGPVCYTPPDEAQKRAQWNTVIERPLTTRFVQTTVTIDGFSILVWKLQDFCFDSASLLPPCPDVHHTCRSGKYTLLLDVLDTLGNHYYDTQQLWFDNKPMDDGKHVVFAGIEGLLACSDMNLSKFAPPGADCSVAWLANLLGIAHDEYIDDSDHTYPSDNFDLYVLSITRQGGPTYQVPITLDGITFGPNTFAGNSRVGEPGVRCEQNIMGCPPPVVPGMFFGLLSKLDLRIFDASCTSIPSPFTPPAGFGLPRPEDQDSKPNCCGYTFELYAQDKTWSDGGGAGQCHRAWSLPWAVCVCNDLPPQNQRPR